jgi:DNA-binding GntR family transcriptional regulator
VSRSRSIADTLAASIRQHIVDEQLGAGVHLTERALAERFDVSRSPVRAALRRLAEEGVMDVRAEDGKYVVGAAGAASGERAQDASEAAYLRIAEDRLAGQLPEKITENELARRYGLGRAVLAAILRRMSEEGWIRRLPGHGWRFLPVLTSGSAYDHGYRFRIAIEPAAILEPDFAPNAAALRRCLDEQLALLGRIDSVSPAELFDANTRLHETIIDGAGNPFFSDSLRRLNSLRRLMEYRKSVDRVAAARRCREHLALIELLQAGKYDKAADFMRGHLGTAALQKASR